MEDHEPISRLPVWVGILACGVLLIIVFLALPYGRLAAGVYIIATALPAVAIAGATWYRIRPVPALAWRLLAAGVALTAVGDTIWLWLDMQGREPFPSVADPVYLAAYPLYAAALWLLGGNEARGDGALTDGLIIAASAGVVGWALLVVPYLHSPGMSTLQVVVSAAYPVADLILLPMVLRLVFLHRTRSRAHELILVGMTCVLVADVLYAHGENTGSYTPGGPIDALWPVSAILFAAAAWHPSSAVDPRGHASPAELSTRRLLILAAAAVQVPLLSLITDHPIVDIDRVAAITAIIIFLLIITRMAGLMRRTQRQADALERLATTDPLTGLLNRRSSEQQLRREMARAERTKAPLHLAYLDLDHFKRYNDTYGHPGGDALLKALADAWSQDMRPTDVLARIGGEEFVVVLPETGGDAARQMIERLRSHVPYGQTCSAGLARFISGETMERLLERSDQALYEAKVQGRDQVVTAE